MLEDAVRKYRDIEEEYRFNPDIMDEDDEVVRRLKYIVEKRLNRVDRVIMILYSHDGSYRTLGKRLNISHTIINREVKRIRKLIIEEYGRIYGNVDDLRGYGLHR